MSHFHHEFIPSLSLSKSGRPLQICAIQLEPVLLSKPSDGAFILPFCLWLALLITSTLLFCQKGVSHLLCLAFQQSSAVTAVLHWPRGVSMSFELAHPALPVSILLGQLIWFVITSSYPLCLLSLTFPIQKLSLTQVESSDLLLWIGFVYSYLSSSYT